MNRFEGKTILVTGAGSGIGAACVRRLFHEGASIVAADSQRQNLENVVSEFGGSDRVQAVTVDVTDRNQVAALVSGAMSRFGTLYGLVNSAGVRCVGNILDLEPDAWRRVISINLDGTFNMCQAFARALREAQNPGVIVNVAFVVSPRCTTTSPSAPT